MLEILLTPDFLLLITLADARLYLAFGTAFLALLIQSHRFSPDRNFQGLVFRVGLAFLLLFFTVNVFLGELAATGGYRPLLIGRVLYLEASEPGALIMRSINTGRDIERLLFQDLWANTYIFFFVNLIIVILGIHTFYMPTPRWVPTIGIQVVDRDVPEIVNASIVRAVKGNLFVYLALTAMTIGAFDLVHIANLLPRNTTGDTIRSYLAESDVDRRFFVTIIVAPAFFSWAVGTLLQLRYRMIYGDLHGYRQGELNRLVSRYRRWSRRRRPRIDRRRRRPPAQTP